MSTNAKTTNRKNASPKNAKPRKPVPSPSPEAATPAPAEAAANAAKSALSKLADAHALHAAACEALRLAKIEAKDADKAAFRAANPKRMGCLEAAYIVLREFPNGLNTKAILRRMYNKDLWRSPAGYTPESTLYAGITREIAAKGAASRFARGPVKGTFVANPLFKAPATAKAAA